MITNLLSSMHSCILICHSVTSSTIDLVEQIYPIPFEKQQVKVEIRKCLLEGEIDYTISDAVQFWVRVLSTKSPIGEQKYFHLATLSLQLLFIPASNADSERVFSLVRRIKTEFHSSLSTVSVSALISCHFNKTSENKHFDECLIAKAKNLHKRKKYELL